MSYLSRHRSRGFAPCNGPEQCSPTTPVRMAPGGGGGTLAWMRGCLQAGAKVLQAYTPSCVGRLGGRRRGTPPVPATSPPPLPASGHPRRPAHTSHSHARAHARAFAAALSLLASQLVTIHCSDYFPKKAASHARSPGPGHARVPDTFGRTRREYYGICELLGAWRAPARRGSGAFQRLGPVLRPLAVASA